MPLWPWTRRRRPREREEGTVTFSECTRSDDYGSGYSRTEDDIIALREAHDSGTTDDRRRDIASNLDNLTIADPTVNRLEKSERDVAEWMPNRHGTWFAAWVIAVNREYELSGDPAERDTLKELLAGNFTSRISDLDLVVNCAMCS